MSSDRDDERSRASRDDLHFSVPTTSDDIAAMREAKKFDRLTADEFVRFVEELPKPDLRKRRTANENDIPFRL